MDNAIPSFIICDKWLSTFYINEKKVDMIMKDNEDIVSKRLQNNFSVNNNF